MDSVASKALRDAAGPENFSTSRQDRVLYASDASNFFHQPQAVIRARDTAQVSRVLAACSAHQVPVVPRGAGSGLTGGAIPVAGGVVLDMAGMNRILEIDTRHQTATVQPGVVTADLQKAVEEKGLFYPPDPASVNFCTVGGNVAENAGGLRAVKYGVTRDYVLGLEAVLADGRVLRSGGSAIKSVVGYDLVRLLVGSEGTLAVMTELTMRLRPLPEAQATVSAYFDSLDNGARGVQEVLASGIIPVACEFMDQLCLEAVKDYAGVQVPAGAQAMLLVEVDGPPEIVERQARDLGRIMARAGGAPVEVARDREQAADLWQARRALGPAIYRMYRGKLNEDVAVPLGNLAELVRRIHQVGRRRGVAIPTFGHAGDGNLHVNVMFDPGQPGQEEAAHQAVSDVFAHTLALKGTLSGEHGVGMAKLGYVGAESDPVALELMRAIKDVFDPAGILNPHKKIPSSQTLE